MVSHIDKHIPTKLFDGADIYNPVMEMIHEVRHVLVEESFIGMHGVASQRTPALWRVLSNKGNHFHLCLLQRDLAVVYSLREA